MNCPKCGHELTNDNGKLICQSCGYGKEVASSVVNQELSVQPVASSQSPTFQSVPPVVQPTLNSQPSTFSQSNPTQNTNNATIQTALNPNNNQDQSATPSSQGIQNQSPTFTPQATNPNPDDQGSKASPTSPFTPPARVNSDDGDKSGLHIKLIIFMVVIVLLIIATLVIGFISYSKLTKVTMIGNKPTGEFTQGEVINCDEIGPNTQISDPTGKNQTCIKESLSQCKPAKVNYASYGANATVSAAKPTPEALVEYQIIGLDNNLCSVKVTYLKIPTLLPNVKQFDYINKSLTCELAYNKDGAFQEFFGIAKGQYFTTVETSTTQPDIKCSGGAYDLQQLMKKALNK